MSFALVLQNGWIEWVYMTPGLVCILANAIFFTNIFRLKNKIDSSQQKTVSNTSQCRDGARRQFQTKISQQSTSSTMN